MINILFVDDEPHVLNAIRRSFQRTDYKMYFAENAQMAEFFLASKNIDIIVSDIMMPGINGIELLNYAMLNYPKIIRIALTGRNDIQSAFEILEEVEVYKYVTKPWDKDELKTIIQEAISQKKDNV